MSLLVGCDPEFQLVLDGKYVSAHDVIPGTKKAPHPVTKGAVQADGTAVEFNIEPAATKEDFVSNINTVMSAVRALIPEQYAFSFHPAIEFPKEYWDSLPPIVTEIGCDPDFSMYSALQPRPAPTRPGTLTCFGGHVHVGWGSGYDVASPEHRNDCRLAAGRFYHMTVPYKDRLSPNKGRSQMYGQSGEFRPKSYGVEFRYLSNEWLSKPHLWPWIFDVSTFCINTLLDDIPMKHPNYTNAWYSAKSGSDQQIELSNKANKLAWGEEFPAFPLE